MSRLPVHTVNIPSREIHSYHRDAGEWIKILREAGIDPRKAADVPLVISLMRSWHLQETTRGKALHVLGNVLIMNPGLASKG